MFELGALVVWLALMGALMEIVHDSLARLWGGR